MGWWRRRGSWSSPDEAYDASVAAGQAGDFATALRAAARAEELFSARGDLEGRAGAARSAWRAANHHAGANAPGEALAAGRRAIDGWTAVVDESGNPTWNRELVRACADASVFAVMASRYDEGVALAARAVEIAQTARDKGLDMGPEMQTERGTALHNLAAAYSSRATAAGPPAPTDLRARSDLQAALRAADEEVRLRRQLARTGPALATWELASGLSQRGRIRMVAAELESARYDLQESRDIAARLGPAGAPLARTATTLLRELGAT
jgi:hypothetical protein